MIKKNKVVENKNDADIKGAAASCNKCNNQTVFILKKNDLETGPHQPERPATVSGSNQDRASGSPSHLDGDGGAHAIVKLLKQWI